MGVYRKIILSLSLVLILLFNTVIVVSAGITTKFYNTVKEDYDSNPDNYFYTKDNFQYGCSNSIICVSEVKFVSPFYAIEPCSSDRSVFCFCGKDSNTAEYLNPSSGSICVGEEVKECDDFSSQEITLIDSSKENYYCLNEMWFNIDKSPIACDISSKVWIDSLNSGVYIKEDCKEVSFQQETFASQVGLI